MKVVARACPNIALVKYWGKRDLVLNLPAAGSLSLTLDGLWTRAEVEFLDEAGKDEVQVGSNGTTDGSAFRVSQFLEVVRSLSGRTDRARVKTDSNFPIGAGLASSASTFAALALASSKAAGLTLEAAEVCALARRGSGSAARSIFGGFVEMKPGSREDGSDAVARVVAEPDHWDVRMVVALTAEGRKAIGSSEAMIRTADTSPLYKAWLACVPEALEEARAAVYARDLRGLGEVMEQNALTMHASAMSARPPILYWNPGTVAAMRQVWELRHDGVECYFTIDAGPHIKVLCAADAAPSVEQALLQVPGVLRTVVAGPGEAAVLEPVDR